MDDAPVRIQRDDGLRHGIEHHVPAGAGNAFPDDGLHHAVGLKNGLQHAGRTGADEKGLHAQRFADLHGPSAADQYAQALLVHASNALLRVLGAGDAVGPQLQPENRGDAQRTFDQVVKSDYGNARRMSPGLIKQLDDVKAGERNLDNRNAHSGHADRVRDASAADQRHGSSSDGLMRDTSAVVDVREQNFQRGCDLIPYRFYLRKYPMVGYNNANRRFLSRFSGQCVHAPPLPACGHESFSYTRFRPVWKVPESAVAAFLLRPLSACLVIRLS